jgi:predicted ATPase/class 3 adenylate cyclase
MRSDLPSGTVTFLFTDVEGSTRLLHALGAEAYAAALAEHRRVIRNACTSEDGVEVDTQGDAFFFAFPTAPAALRAAASLTDALSSGPIRVRVGLHTGTPHLSAEGYVGEDVHRAARIAAAGHGGQVLVSSSTAQLVDLDLTDLGEHRLKDLSGPERIYQLGEGDFPALKSLHRTNLPVPATPFLGREDELLQVLALLSSEDTRLLTLTGPGGTGKTRLALQAAAEASEAFADGIWWVPLAPLRDPKLVLEMAAQAVGSPNGLAEYISDKSMLCLFDNFEQVVEAGAELAEVVALCPNLKVLVTSRERLRVRGEQTYPVPQLAERDGMALFSARARAVDPTFSAREAVRELCLRLDELPLALELAAARTALFSPEQLLERLAQRLDLLKGDRDADPRQQTLRATIEWSYDLLDEQEQVLFARLSVFAGGCTYEAAEAIAGADPDTLQSLLDKSLVRKREAKLGPRYWMLETIREFALERLEESSEADARQWRHAEHFLDLAEEAEAHLATGGAWLDRLDAEVDNLRSALDFATGREPQRALRAAAALDDFWFMRGRISEGRARLENALAADREPTAARCQALIAATQAGVACGDELTARARVAEALDIASALADAHLRALARYAETWLLADEGEWSAAREILEDVVPVLRELGDWDMAIRANRTLAWTYEELGDKERFWALTEENLEHAQVHGQRRIEARSLGALAERAASERRFEDADTLLTQSFRIDLELGNLPFVSVDLVRFALTSARKGKPLVGAQLLSRAAALRDEIAFALESWMTTETEEALAAVRAQLDEEAFAGAWDAGAKLSLDQAVALALGE